MNRITVIIISLFFITKLSFAQENDCTRVTTFGEVELCLPMIEGYTEFYKDPIVKQLADGTEVPTNTVLAYYLSNDMYDNKRSTNKPKISIDGLLP